MSPRPTDAAGPVLTRRPRVLVLATGGTIAGRADARAASAYAAGKIDAAELLGDVPGLDKLATLSALQVASIGSQDMNDQVWFELARRIQAAFAADLADGVVITHGTDTLEETAFFLDQALAGHRPVVLTGAMRPATAPDADGPANLLAAVAVAAAPASAGRGVLVALGGQIQAARWVQKIHATALQAFASPNAGPLGHVDAAGVRFEQPLAQSLAQSTRGRDGPAYRLPANAPLPRVDIIHAHANMDAAPIDDAARRGARGIVLAGVGNGNTSAPALAALSRAARSGVLVVRASLIGAGRVSRNVEIADDAQGFVAALDLNAQKARILAQLLIANGITQPEAAQAAFARACCVE